jgi:hypothetical protein
MHGPRPPLSEAERLLLEQSEDLDGLFFDLTDLPEDLDADLPDDPDFDLAAVLEQRPRTRADCSKGPRPCPWVQCRHHLFLDVRQDGVVRINFPGGPESMLSTCSLDLANDGPRNLEQISVLMGMSRERVRQLEERALVKLRFAIRKGDLDYAGTTLETSDESMVAEEETARVERLAAIERRAARLAAKEAKREAKRQARLARARPFAPTMPTVLEDDLTLLEAADDVL